MTDNRAVLEIEQDQEQEVIATARNSHSRAPEASFSRPRTGFYATPGERGAAAASATTLNATPILLTIAASCGAVCVGTWACLNLLHWFWQQLQ
jgi:hypothetical protein